MTSSFLLRRSTTSSSLLSKFLLRSSIPHLLTNNNEGKPKPIPIPSPSPSPNHLFNPSLTPRRNPFGSGPHTQMSKQFSTTATGSPTVPSAFRPLSPHLTIYAPQKNSTISIINRISAAGVSGLMVYYYLVLFKMSPICMTFNGFYDVAYYSMKMGPLCLEIGGLAVGYHIAHTIRDIMEKHDVHPFKKFLGNAAI